VARDPIVDDGREGELGRELPALDDRRGHLGLFVPTERRAMDCERRFQVSRVRAADVHAACASGGSPVSSARKRSDSKR
jgi:hypothetical protein